MAARGYPIGRLSRRRLRRVKDGKQWSMGTRSTGLADDGDVTVGCNMGKLKACKNRSTTTREGGTNG